MPHLSPILWILVYSLIWFVVLMMLISIESVNPSLKFL